MGHRPNPGSVASAVCPQKVPVTRDDRSLQVQGLQTRRARPHALQRDLQLQETLLSCQQKHQPDLNESVFYVGPPAGG